MTTVAGRFTFEVTQPPGKQPPIDDVRQFAFRNGVTIDDTPADTEEQTMGKMTITQEQFEAACTDARITSASGRIITERLGITITPAEPPEMVKLAGRAAFLEAENARLRQHIADEANRVNIAGSAYDRAQAALDEIVAGVKNRARTALGAGG